MRELKLAANAGKETRLAATASLGESDPESEEDIPLVSDCLQLHVCG